MRISVSEQNECYCSKYFGPEIITNLEIYEMKPTCLFITITIVVQFVSLHLD